MKILSVDSSSITASVSLLEINKNKNNNNNIKIISEFFVNAGLTHSQTLAPMIDILLKNSDTNINNIDLFGVTVGPGSFTGLRIGLSIIKGMAVALNKSCVGVSSLEAAAYNYYDFCDNNIIISCMDARRDQVYNSVFETKNNKLIRILPDNVCDIKELYDKIIDKLKNFTGCVKFVGDGADLCYDYFLNNNNNINFCDIDITKKYIKASSIGILAYETYNKSGAQLPEDINPVYLRLSQAERLLLEKNK